MYNKFIDIEIKTLEDVQCFLNNIEFINEGGCGIAMLAMYRWLKKNKQLNKSTCFYYLYSSWSENRYLNNKEVLKTKNGKPDCCTHAMLYHNDLFIDSLGNYNFSIVSNDYNWLQKITDEKFIIDSINNYNYNTWNSDFERKKNIKIIEKGLNIDLSDICLKYN